MGGVIEVVGVELPKALVFHRAGHGVYDSADGRVTLYRIEGCSPAAWNVEWTIEYGGWLRDHDPDYTHGSIALSNIVDGAGTKRDALALAAEAWPKLRARVAAIEAAERASALAAAPRYVVRKQSSGRTASESFYVARRGGGRVSVHASRTRGAAEVEAEALNVASLVLDHESDPRPYEARLAEAREAWTAAVSA